MANMQVTVVDGNNVTVSLDRGVAGVGIASISLVVINQANYLLITYTNGTTQTVGPVGVIQYNATTPINISGSTISLLTVPVNLGGTGQTTANAGLNALLPAQTSQANKYLQTDGTNSSWDAISLSTADITGVLPVVNGGTGVSTSTGTGNTVLSTSPTLVTPVLGTPASGTLTNATGLPVATGISGLGTGIATFLATPSSANLAAALTDETGTGAAVFAISPTFVTPALGTPASGVMTNVTGTAAGLTAGNVSTNANLTGGVTSIGNAATVITNADLTGDVTSIGNATTLTNAPVIAKVLTGYISGAGTVAATDSILQAIQKLDGNNSTNANLTGPITSVGNVTSIASQTGTGTKFVVDTSPTLITPDLGTPTALVGTNITGTALSFTSSNVTTNANLTGDITSVGNATAIAAGVIVNADISASAAIDDTKLATIATALKVSNSATTATATNTASAIVARDASGNFSAGTVSATLTGNASTATALATGRTIEITGDLLYTSPSFDGSANVTAAGTLATVATAGITGSSTAIPVVTINAKGLTTSITTAVVIAPAGTLSGSTLAAGVTGSSLTSLGTIASLSVTAGTISTTPSASTDIANKDYVDTVAQGLDPKASCVAATTANITLSGTQTIDGVALIATDRCLVKNQTAQADNGIYVVAAGAWARSADMNAWVEVPGAFAFIEQGTTQADTGWVCTSNAGGTLGTTAITFVQFAGVGSYTASTGLTLTGAAFSLTAPVTVALGGTNATSAGIAAFNNITGYTAAGATGTTSTNLVFSTSPTLITPALGTPSALVGTNITGTATAFTASNVTTNANLTGAVTSVGNATSLGSFTSANLAAALTDETGTGANVFATSPTLVTPALGTPTALVLTSATGLPLTTGVTGTLPVANGGTGVTTSTGTGDNVLSASPTLTGTVAAASLSLSSLTSGRVTYAGTAGLLQDSANLTFSGTALAVGGTLSATGAVNFTGPSLTLGAATVYDAIVNTTESMYFNVDSNNDQTGSKFQWGENRAATTGGTTFATLDVAGLAVTGTLSATGTTSIGSGTALGTVPLDVHTLTGVCEVGIYANSNASATAHAQLRLYSGGASGGDPIVNWEVTGGSRYYMGIDNSNSDKLVIGSGYNPGASDYLTIDATGLKLTGLLTVNGGASDVVSYFNSTSANGAHIRIQSSGVDKAYMGCAPGFLGSGTANDLGIRAVGSILFATNGSTVDMTLDSSGNLSVIGAILSTGASATVQARLNGSDTFGAGASLGITNTAADRIWLTQLSASNNYDWWYFDGAAAARKMTLDTSGNLLVGKTSASAFATVGTEINATGFVAITRSGSISLLLNRETSNGEIAQFRRSNTAVGSIDVTTTATSYVTSSDYRLKNTIAPMTGALAKVALLKPCTYKWNADGSDGQGFIAHELQIVVPDCVTGKKDAVETYTDEDGNGQTRPVHQGVDTSFLVATLTAAIQEQQALIASLTARLDAANL